MFQLTFALLVLATVASALIDALYYGKKILGARLPRLRRRRRALTPITWSADIPAAQGMAATGASDNASPDTREDRGEIRPLRALSQASASSSGS